MSSTPLRPEGLDDAGIPMCDSGSASRKCRRIMTTTSTPQFSPFACTTVFLFVAFKRQTYPTKYHDCVKSVMSASHLSPILRGSSLLARRSGTVPWTCRTCLQSQRQTLLQQRNSFASRVDAATRPVAKNSKRRRRLLVLGAGIALGATVVTVNDEAKHAWAAAQRTSRVATTLALNIKE